MTIFHLPDLGEGLPDAEIQQWYVNEGDEITLDQPLVAMETAKAVVDVPSPIAGRVAKLHGKPGDIILTGAPLIEFVSDTPIPAAETHHATATSAASSPQTARAINSVKAAPAVRMLANKLNVDLNTVAVVDPMVR